MVRAGIRLPIVSAVSVIAALTTIITGPIARNSDITKATISALNTPVSHFAVVFLVLPWILRLKSHSIPENGKAKYATPINELATIPATRAASSGPNPSSE